MIKNLINRPIPNRAFILAAGEGSRLAPLTDKMPKPLVSVGHKPIIDRTLDQLGAIGVKHVTINLHHLAKMLQDHLMRRKDSDITLSLSFEEKLLNTGGGIKKALWTMGNEAFFAFSGDTLWEDGPSGNTLERLAAAWDDETMDMLLLLQPLDTMTITDGGGDYHLSPEGKPIRADSRKKDGAYFWPSIRIVHPRLFAGTPDTPFSFLELMDKAERNGRLGALVHDGTCYHISRMQDLDAVNKHFDLHSRQTAQGGPRVA